MKELDRKFNEFENAAIQREKDYKQIIEQQRMDADQMKGFEKLKEANLDLRAVSIFLIQITAFKNLNLVKRILKFK